MAVVVGERLQSSEGRWRRKKRESEGWEKWDTRILREDSGGEAGAKRLPSCFSSKTHSTSDWPVRSQSCPGPRRISAVIGYKCRYAQKVWLKLLSQQTKRSDCTDGADRKEGAALP